MGIQSNVTIKSNVYVNKSKSQFDEEFIRQVRGYDALAKVKASMAPFQYTLLTEPQRHEHEYGKPDCSLDKTGDKSWGLIIENNHSVFVCKCEHTGCEGWGRRHRGYDECSGLNNFRKIDRLPDTSEYLTDSPVKPDFRLLRYLDPEDQIIYLNTVRGAQKGYDAPIITIKRDQPEVDEKGTKGASDSGVEAGARVPDEPQLTQQEDPTAIDVERAVAASVEYVQIDRPDEIITANMDDRIIVNAGPGTGKTYSVVQRLGYIFNNELADPTNMLVLCFSRSAVGEIKKRILAEVEHRNMPMDAIRLFHSIRTFDSFATYLLADGETEGAINHLDYDQRIEKFIAELKNNKTVFDGLEYLIIDEMQDLVGVRARMVKEILQNIDCGFLLLGDMCQSIYDYQIQDENELDSVKYYQWLNTHFNTGVKRLELTKNVRQIEEIAAYTRKMRDAILSGSEDAQADSLALCVGALQQQYNLGHIRTSGRINPRSSEAILCRNNAEVSIISGELFAKDIKHRISKRSQHVDLVPWIAEVLSTYTESKIGYKAFRERVLQARYEDADSKWTLLKTGAADENESVLDLRLLVKTLVAGKDIPFELDLAISDAATISTIHRAKGREYSGVVLVSDDYNRNGKTLDEIKVAYVALTRGKEQISFCDIPSYYTRQINSKRWIATGRSRKSHKIFCSNFDIGLAEDVDPYSFVSKELEDVAKNQKYIAALQPGDPLEVWLIGHSYQIIHNGVHIGNLSNKIFFELRDAMDKTNHSSSLPNHLTNICVNNVVTVANTKYNEAVAEPYNKSGLWLGVEISGFAKTDWS